MNFVNNRFIYVEIGWFKKKNNFDEILKLKVNMIYLFFSVEFYEVF